MEETTGYYSTFVVRIWCDKNGQKVRGQIQHAGTREHAYFVGLGEMEHFMLNHLDPPCDGAAPSDIDGWNTVLKDFAQDE